MHILDIQNRWGSVQHYYHFLLGFLTPLVEYIHNKDIQNEEIMVRDCGPMNNIIKELNYNIIFGETKWHKNIKGYDDPVLYNKNAFNILSNYLQSKNQNKELIDILIIERKCDPFYNSKLSEIKLSGVERRSIINHEEVVNNISSYFPYHIVKNVSLEGMSIYKQYSLFNNSKIVVAQHGAALANIIFMNPMSHVIEMGNSLNKVTCNKCFSSLCKIMNVNWIYQDYKSDHVKVNTENIIASIQKALIRSIKI